MKYDPIQLKAAYDIMPDEIQEMFDSPYTIRVIGVIAEQQNLTADQAHKLAYDVSLVLVCLIKPTELAENLKTDLAISDYQAAEIANEIEKEVLQPVKDLIDHLNSEAGKQDLELKDNGGIEYEQHADLEQIEHGVDTEENLEKEKVLTEIENPEPLKMIEDKLSTPVKQPKEEIKVGYEYSAQKPEPKASNFILINKRKNPDTNTEEETESKTSAAPANLPTDSNAPKPKQYAKDPYREPLE